MRLEGTRAFAEPRETVWEVLNDPSRLAQAMPGLESFEVQDDTHWRARVRIPLGAGGLRMEMDFTKTESRPPEFSTLAAKGRGVGAIVQMKTAFHLADNGSGTEMRWEADVSIAGPVGSLGRRVLEPIVNHQVESVLTALDAQVTEAARTEAR